MTPIELRARREALGLTQASFAAVIGVAQATVSAWERGTRRIPDGIAAELRALEDRQDALIDRMIDAAEAVAQAGAPTLITHSGDGLLSGPVHDTTGPPLPAAVHRVAVARAKYELARDGIEVRIAPS